MSYAYQAQMSRNKYLETTIQTATPAQLLIMLYDGAIRFCRLGTEAIQNGNMEEANRNIIRAQDIILEFVVTLDKSAEVAEGLVKLYDYMYRRLIEANMKKDTEILQEVTGYLTELKETWIEAAKIANKQPAGNGPTNAAQVSTAGTGINEVGGASANSTSSQNSQTFVKRDIAHA